MEDIGLPQVLRSVISGETYDFALKSGLRRPFRKSLSQITFGLIFTAVTGVFVYIYLNSVNFSDAGAIDTLGSGKLARLLFAAFLATGLTILLSGIFKAFSRGGYFVGTAKGLISCRKGKIHTTDWQRFAGDITIKGNENKGSIELVMRPGNLGAGETNLNYAPGIIYITSIRDPFEIERLIRRRIRENDPTPAIRR
jgi:hypothetical protein